MFLRSLIFTLFLGIAACASTAADGPLPKPDQNGSYLFWNPQEQIVGYRNIEKIFPTHTIRRGSRVAPLPDGPPLPVSYTFRGEPWDTARFMRETIAGGVLVIHKDRVVLEEYAHGYAADQRWISFSVAKSMSSTLAGAALKDGYIKSLEDPVTNYLPGLRGTAYEGVTVRHLLNMTSGVKWNEDYADPNSDVGRLRTEKSVNGSDPIITFMSRLPREAEPGTKFVYKTGETHLIGALVRAATGKDLADYLTEKVWRPYGMEKDAVWMLDDAGHEYAGCCVSATLRDFGRFAHFFMNGAVVNGESIVPDTWIRDATTSSAAAARPNGSGYGYQWWINPGGVYEGRGIFGQVMHIDPAQDLVIIVQSAWPTSGHRPSAEARAAWVNAVRAAIAARGG